MFGSQGGGTASNKGGKGAYTSGLVWLQENAHLYFYVGNNGAASLVTLDDSYNLDADITSSAIMVAAGGGDSNASSATCLPTCFKLVSVAATAYLFLIKKF